jgi:hypothetical protein
MGGFASEQAVLYPPNGIRRSGQQQPSRLHTVAGGKGFQFRGRIIQGVNRDRVHEHVTA